MIRAAHVPNAITTASASIIRRFAPHANFLSLVRANAASKTPPDSSIGSVPLLTPISQKTFEDVYYDTPSATLNRAGLTLRRRGGAWQLVRARLPPIPLPPSSAVPSSANATTAPTATTNNAVAPSPDADPATAALSGPSGALFDRAQIADILDRLVPGCTLFHGGARGLAETARFTFVRHAWAADLTEPADHDGAAAAEASTTPPQCRVVHDDTGFGHAVGELRVEVYGALAETQALEHRARLDAFAWRHAALFNPAVAPVGKLQAYFATRVAGEERLVIG